MPATAAALCTAQRSRAAKPGRSGVSGSERQPVVDPMSPSDSMQVIAWGAWGGSVHPPKLAAVRPFATSTATNGRKARYAEEPGPPVTRRRK